MKSFKLIWKLICYNPKQYILDAFIWTLVHSSELLLGLITKEFFDKLSNHASISEGVWGLVILFSLVSLSRIGLLFCGAPIDILVRFKISALVRRNLLEQIVKYPGAESLKYSSGEIINRFRDDALKIEDTISWTLDLIGSAVFAIISISILLSINAKITCLVFTPLVCIVLVAHLASNKIEQYRTGSRIASDAVTGAIGEVFGSIQAIQLAGAENHIISHFEKLNDNRRRLAVKDSLLTQGLNLIFENTVSIGTGLILLLTANSMSDGSFSVGDFSLFAFCLTYVTDFTTFFGSFLSDYRQSGVAFTRLTELFEDKNTDGVVKYAPLYLREKVPEFDHIEKSSIKKLDKLQIRQLTHLYQESGGGIKDVSFDIVRGSFTVITGRMGSGKSTLVKTIFGLLKADNGKVFWNGDEIKNPDMFFVPPYVAYISQMPSLFGDTIKNNILLGLSEEKVDFAKVIESAVLGQDLGGMEKGLETIVGSNGAKVSGGQLQRIAVARMFARDSDLLVLDDISSALDSNTENKLWQGIADRKDQTCIVVSNRKVCLKRADNIIVMKDGQVEAEGNLQWLLDNCDEMKCIWGI